MAAGQTVTLQSKPITFQIKLDASIPPGTDVQLSARVWLGAPGARVQWLRPLVLADDHLNGQAPKQGTVTAPFEAAQLQKLPPSVHSLRAVVPAPGTPPVKGSNRSDVRPLERAVSWALHYQQSEVPGHGRRDRGRLDESPGLAFPPGTSDAGRRTR